MTTVDPHELSWGDRDDRSTHALRDLQILQPPDSRSEYEVLWMARLPEQVDKRCRLAFSDGCGRDGDHSFACHRMSVSGWCGKCLVKENYFLMK